MRLSTVRQRYRFVFITEKASKYKTRIFRRGIYGVIARLVNALRNKRLVRLYVENKYLKLNSIPALLKLQHSSSCYTAERNSSTHLNVSRYIVAEIMRTYLFLLHQRITRFSTHKFKFTKLKFITTDLN